MYMERGAFASFDLSEGRTEKGNYRRLAFLGLTRNRRVGRRQPCSRPVASVGPKRNAGMIPGDYSQFEDDTAAIADEAMARVAETDEVSGAYARA